jgi:septal ring-binding cell division protein DamX
VCAGNVLANPGFEGGFSERGAGEVSVANGWFPWWQDGPGQDKGYYRRPEYKPEDASRYGRRRVRSGNFAQKFFNTFSTHNAGILQQVQVPADSILTLSAWVQAWSSQYHDPDTVKDPGNYRVYIGIDPTGGTDWSSPNVIWSEPAMQYNTWINLQLQAKAKAGTITVFLRGQPEFRTQFNDSYWDDICLTVQRPTPRPTNTPTITPTPTSSPTPTATPTPLPGNVCVSVYQDLNENGQREDGEALISGAVIALLDGSRAELETYTTDGVNEPYCFQGLVAGDYYVQRQNPSGYVSTEPDEKLVAVEPGTSADIGFGAEFVPTPTPTSTATPTRTPTPTPTPQPIIEQVGNTVYGVSGIILAALALIILLGLQVLRKRQ